jgi:tRNA A-37 threonylcarbamoyl transferase component Bud32
VDAPPDAAARFGRYEILRPLGRGGMAEVYLARTIGPAGVEKRLVIKKVLPALARDRRFVDLFISEARVALSLTHGNIVPVFDFGREGEDYYLAMEYVAGRDLEALLEALRRAGRRLDPGLAAHVAAEVCHALDHAHRARDARGRPLGLVHRDVTPRNVLLSWDGEVKLTDFGVSRVGEAAPTRLRGTIGYMAPEQARGEPLDGRSDLYAVGLILREALEGARVYAGDDAAALLERVRRGELPPVAAAAPPALRAVAERATAAAPGERFPDALAMASALEAHVAAAPAAVPPSRALAALLAELFPDGAREDLAGAPPAAPAGSRSQLSRAATVGDDEGAPAVAPAAPGSAHRVRLPLALAAGALVAVGVFVLARPGRTPAPVAVRAPARAPASAPASAPAPASQRAAAPPGPSSAPATRSAAGTRPAAAPARPAASGTLDLNCVPWCEATIDGRPVGQTPLAGLVLPAGRHTLRVHNAQLGVTRTRAIDIRPGEVNRQRVNLAPGP